MIKLVELSARIKLLRQQKHLTQAQLAYRLGITKSMVSAYETGMRSPSYQILIKLAHTFSVSTDYLLGVAEYKGLDITGLNNKQIELIKCIVEEFKNLK